MVLRSPSAIRLYLYISLSYNVERRKSYGATSQGQRALVQNLDTPLTADGWRTSPSTQSGLCDALTLCICLTITFAFSCWNRTRPLVQQLASLRQRSLAAVHDEEHEIHGNDKDTTRMAMQEKSMGVEVEVVQSTQDTDLMDVAYVLCGLSQRR